VVFRDTVHPASCSYAPAFVAFPHPLVPYVEVRRLLPLHAECGSVSIVRARIHAVAILAGYRIVSAFEQSERPVAVDSQRVLVA
jgi:hypothetical protein